MPIKQLTPMQAVQDYIKNDLEAKEKILMNILYFSGENGVRVARLNGSYTDRTGNLRSSTGFVVVKNGNVVGISDFSRIAPKVKEAGKKQNGSVQGKEFARKIVNEFPSGIAVIGVAGVNYAAKVAARGYDVVDSAEAEMQRVFLRELRRNGFIAK